MSISVLGTILGLTLQDLAMNGAAVAHAALNGSAIVRFSYDETPFVPQSEC